MVSADVSRDHTNPTSLRALRCSATSRDASRKKQRTGTPTVFAIFTYAERTVLDGFVLSITTLFPADSASRQTERHLSSDFSVSCGGNAR